ncbi:MAG TPA: hypothetical protein PKU91_06695, partial [Phycisphaerales bacterium]|nr:hypothetical protein [Phycisphaerales bacterium]
MSIALLGETPTTPLTRDETPFPDIETRTIAREADQVRAHAASADVWNSNARSDATIRPSEHARSPDVRASPGLGEHAPANTRQTARASPAWPSHAATPASLAQRPARLLPKDI